MVLVLTDKVVWELVEAAPDAALLVDDAGRIVLVNRRVEELFGYARSELLDHPVEMLLPFDAREAHKAQRQEYQDHSRVRPMGAGLDLRARRRDGSEIPVEISLSPLVAGEERYTIAVVRDVTARKETERAMQAINDALLLAEERDRIARDLHDTVIQRLFAVGLSLQAALHTDDSGRVRERLHSAIDELDVTVREVRTVIFGLHNDLADSAPPSVELTGLAREAARILGFEPTVVVQGSDGPLPDTVRPHLLATVREALSNIARHAQASSACVELTRRNGQLQLVVADDGVGIASDAPVGAGLRNMGDRANALGGSCTISRGERAGTRVEWRVPV